MSKYTEKNETPFYIGHYERVGEYQEIFIRGCTDVEEKSKYIDFLCGDEYNPNDVLGFYCVDNFEEGFAFTVDSFCYTYNRHRVRIVPYNDIQTIYYTTSSDNLSYTLRSDTDLNRFYLHCPSMRSSYAKNRGYDALGKLIEHVCCYATPGPSGLHATYSRSTW